MFVYKPALNNKAIRFSDGYTYVLTTGDLPELDDNIHLVYGDVVYSWPLTESYGVLVLAFWKIHSGTPTPLTV